MLECAIHPITYRGEGILATVVKGMATIRHIRIDQCHIPCVDDKGNITLMMDSIHTIHFTSGVDDQYFRCRVDAPLAVVRPSQNPDLRLSRIRLFAKRIVHIYQLYKLTYIRGLTNG